MGYSYPKITLETMRHQFGSLLITLSQSNFSLRSSDSNSVLSYLITTVTKLILTTKIYENENRECLEISINDLPMHNFI